LLWYLNLDTNRLTACFIGMVVITLFLWAGFGFVELKKSDIRFEKWDWTLSKEMFFYTWPLLPAILLGYFANWGNQIIIQGFFSSKDVGFYQTAFQVHALMVTMAVPLTTIILPKLIMKHMEDATIMKRYIAIMTPTLYCFWLIAIIPLIVIMPFLFKIIFGSSFVDAIPALKILLCCTPTCAMGQIYTVLYSVQKKRGINTLIVAFMVAVNISIALLLLPEEGILAVALAFTVSFNMAQFVTFLFQHFYLKVSPLKVGSLFLAGILFSLGQVYFDSMLTRVGWGLISLLFIGFLARQTRAIDSEIVERLLLGRFKGLGRVIIKVLVKP